MDKLKLLADLKASVEDQLKNAKESYQSALDYSRSEDMKSDGKYDTRATEAGYLASAKKQRVDELEQELKLLEAMDASRASSEAALGSLILLQLNNVKQWHFLSSTGGGSLVELDGVAVLVISVFSPLGAELIGLEQGDSFELETPKGAREYTILEIK